MAWKPWQRWFGSVPQQRGGRVCSDVVDLAGKATRLHQRFVLRPMDEQGRKFAERIDLIASQITPLVTPYESQELCESLDKHVSEFAEFQRGQVNEMVTGLSESIDDLLERLSMSIVLQADRIDEINRIRGCISEAEGADTLDRTKALLSAGLAGIQKMVERELEQQSDMRADHQEYTLRLRDKLDVVERESRTDVLTGIANRTGVNRHLQSVLDHVRISGSNYSFALLDLNGFKQINDEHGHVTGDAALVGFAQRLQASVGKGAFVGRLGGDEFVVVALMSADLLDRVLYRLNEHLEQHPVLCQGTSLRLTTSFGVQGIKRTSSIEQLMREGDRVLYEQKRSGPSKRVA